MKVKLKLLAILGILLLTPKAYAFENVVSLGVGASLTQEKLNQTISKPYSYTVNQEKQQQTINDVKSIQRTFKDDSVLSNFNFEYQARFTNFAIATGINNSNPIFEATFNNNVASGDTKIKLQSHYTDIYAAFLWNVIKANNFTISFGPSLGIGYAEINNNSSDYLFNSKNSNQIYFSPKLLVDGEYRLSKHFSVYSRLNLFPSFLLKKVQYNTNLHTAEDESQVSVEIPANKKRETISVPAPIKQNDMSFTSNTFVKLDFGVRYKF